jgi:hypothetical protein
VAASGQTDLSRRTLTDPGCRDRGFGVHVKIDRVTTPIGAGMVKSVTWFLVVVFLILFAATSPEAAANATRALWDLLVRLFDGLSAFVEDLAGGSSAG